jgi:O-acetyl-ADP-ribose deacetylase (regulator of RNase III)
MSSIRLLAASCSTSFSTLCQSLLETGDGGFQKLISPDALDDERGRFRVWCANLGVLSRGHSSLDYRLRESPLLQETVLKFLADLKGNLDEAILVVTEQRLPFEQQARPPDDSDDDVSESSYAPSESEYGGEDLTELGMRFFNVIDIINNLYSLSIRIRNPVLRTRGQKAASYRPIDKSTGVDLLAEYSKYDLQHVREVIATLRREGIGTEQVVQPEDDYMVERLSNAITRRRQLFLYWRKHREKLAAEVEAVEDTGTAKPPPTVKPIVEDQSNEQTPIEVIKIAPDAISEVKPKTLLSATTATQHHRSLDDAVDETRSMTSVATTAKDLSGYSIELPPPPSVSENKDFECPYCLTICPARYSNYRSWRNHLLQDLSPYLCTYKNCIQPDQLFQSRREWDAHEGTHRKVWLCLQHPDAAFASAASFEKHLLEKHGEEHFNEIQLRSISQVSATAAEDDRACPICLAHSSAIPNMQSHIANHLERFAAFALPKDAQGDDDDSGGSNMPSRGGSDESKSNSLQWHSQDGSDTSSMTGQETRGWAMTNPLIDESTKIAPDSSLRHMLNRLLQVCADIEDKMGKQGRPGWILTSRLRSLRRLFPGSEEASGYDPPDANLSRAFDTYLGLIQEMYEHLEGGAELFFNNGNISDTEGLLKSFSKRIGDLAGFVEALLQQHENTTSTALSTQAIGQLPDSRNEKMELLMSKDNSQGDLHAHEESSSYNSANAIKEDQLEPTGRGAKLWFTAIRAQDLRRYEARELLSNAFSRLSGFQRIRVRNHGNQVRGTISFDNVENASKAMENFHAPWTESLRNFRLSPSYKLAESGSNKLFFGAVRDENLNWNTAHVALVDAFAEFEGFEKLEINTWNTQKIGGFILFHEAEAASYALSKYQKLSIPQISELELSPSASQIGFKLGREVAVLEEDDKEGDIVDESEDSDLIFYPKQSSPRHASILTLEQIPSLTSLYQSRQLVADSRNPYREWPLLEFNDKVCFVFHDITKLAVDAIVNGTNRNLHIGSSDSLSYAIHFAAGSDLSKACQDIGGVALGEACITDAYKLPCKKVIHTAHPMAYGEYERLLANCYTRSLELAVQNQLKSIAFPSLGTGGYSLPRREATTIALRATREFLNSGKGHSIEKIIFCVFNNGSASAYKEVLPRFFPPIGDNSLSVQGNEGSWMSEIGITPVQLSDQAKLIIQRLGSFEQMSTMQKSISACSSIASLSFLLPELESTIGNADVLVHIRWRPAVTVLLKVITQTFLAFEVLLEDPQLPKRPQDIWNSVDMRIVELGGVPLNSVLGQCLGFLDCLFNMFNG